MNGDKIFQYNIKLIFLITVFLFSHLHSPFYLFIHSNVG